MTLEKYLSYGLIRENAHHKSIKIIRKEVATKRHAHEAVDIRIHGCIFNQVACIF